MDGCQRPHNPKVGGSNPPPPLKALVDRPERGACQGHSLLRYYNGPIETLGSGTLADFEDPRPADAERAATPFDG
jgi:hypothetical protein